MDHDEDKHAAGNRDGGTDVPPAAANTSATLGPSAEPTPFADVYEVLRSQAGRMMNAESPGHTLQPTALVHEAYLRLAGEDPERWQSRTHFLAVAARAMRRILIDHARARSRQKRGDGWRRVTFDDGAAPGSPQATFDALDLIHFDRCLADLERGHARLGRVAEMKLYGGMTCQEIAAFLGVSQRTAEGDWAFARRWLGQAFAGESGGDDDRPEPAPSP